LPDGGSNIFPNKEKLSGRLVLVVEDEYFIADEIAEALREAGAEVLGPVPELKEALRLLELEKVDLAILDINLKNGITFEVADLLATRNIPFVFATGYDRSSIPERHKTRAVWEKPFNARDLVDSLG
jgi:two-component SAPR family response regulator